MKKTILGLAMVILSVSIYSQQEAAKPIYKIESFREGVSIGSFNVELFPLIAPKAVRYFDSLVTIKFYDSTAFHRVVPGFVIQGGDPNSKHLPRETWGNGDTSQTNVPAEFSNVSYARGVLGAARDTDPNSANSQFFICVANATSLNAQYTAYGKVVSGINICDSIVASPRDANDNPLKKIDMFVTKIGTNDSVPAVPVTIGPANNAGRITLDSSLTWSAVSGAVLYLVEIAADSNFSTKIFSGEIASPGYTLKSVQLGMKKYFWRVCANNGGHRSAFTTVRSFTTAISIPAMLQPVSGSTNVPANVWLRWNVVPVAVSYHLQVSTTSTFTQAGIVFDQKGIVDTVKQMSGLQLTKKHYWRVSAETQEYEGAFSQQWNFSTGTSTIVTISEEIPKQFSLGQNYPNPFNPTTTISYNLPVSGFVSLKIFDLLGKEITALVNESKEPGIYSATFDASKLVSGIYFYRLSAGEFIQTKKLILMK